MSFDGELGAIESGAYADVCDRAVSASSDESFGGVNTVSGQQLLFGGKIQCWEDEAPAGARARADFSSEGKGAGEEACGLHHVSAGNSGANGAAGNDDAANDDGRNALDIEIAVRAEFVAESREHLDVARLSVAETESFADANDEGMQNVDQDAADEIFRRERGDGVIEGKYENCVESERLQIPEALGEGFDERRSDFRTDYAQRMWPESERGCDGAFAAGAFNDAFDDLLMTEMHAIEITDGKNAAGLRAEMSSPFLSGARDKERRSGHHRRTSK